MDGGRKFITRILPFIIGAGLIAGCAGGALTTREKAAGIGTLRGAAAGGINGSVGRPAAGALNGDGLGLGADALIGDHLQGQEYKNHHQEQQIRRNQAELQRQDSEQLKAQEMEY